MDKLEQIFVMQKALNDDIQERRNLHFTQEEWIQKTILATISELAEVLEAIRVHFDRPVVVSSGYRTEAHNAAKGGAAYSRHKYGMAADIRIYGVSPVDIAAYAETLLKGRGGIGIYKSFCHVDVRETRSRWQG